MREELNVFEITGNLQRERIGPNDSESLSLTARSFRMNYLVGEWRLSLQDIRRGRGLLRVGVRAGVSRLQAWVARRGTSCPLWSLRLRSSSHIVVHHVAVPVDVAVVVVVLGVDERLGDVLLRDVGRRRAPSHPAPGTRAVWRRRRLRLPDSTAENILNKINIKENNGRTP